MEPNLSLLYLWLCKRSLLFLLPKCAMLLCHQDGRCRSWGGQEPAAGGSWCEGLEQGESSPGSNHVGSDSAGSCPCCETQSDLGR